MASTINDNVAVTGNITATGSVTAAGVVNTGTASNTGATTLTGGATLGTSALTAGTMTAVANAELRYTWSKFTWTNAMVVALGANLTGDITVCTLPAKTIVRRCLVQITTPDTSSNNLTVAVGTVSTGYIDFVVASDAKATAGTIYGDAFAEIGTNLSHIVNTSEQTPADFIPSMTTTTAVKAHFIKSTTNLSTVVGSTGVVWLETAILP